LNSAAGILRAMFRLLIIVLTVTGVLKGNDGKPVAGIRVAAVPRPDSVSEVSASGAMSAIAETDSEGRYVLESISPGRYYIAAGRLDKRTYFPGTSDIAAAKDLLIGAGQKVSGIDFVLSDGSFGREVSRQASLPLVVVVEGGGPMPLSSNGKMTAIALTSPERSLRSLQQIDRNSFLLFFGLPGTYRVVVENLPERYVVKSMTYRSLDLLTNTLQFAPLDPTVPIAPTLLPVQALADLQTVNTMRYTPITVTLAPALPQAKAGVHVWGRFDAAAVARQTIYLSNLPGDLYADGTFEFWGVPPGRHSIVTRNNANDAFPFGGSLVVGDRDIGNIVLSELSLTPKQLNLPGPRPAGDHPTGLVPLARISGSVVEEASRKPIVDGSVVIKSNDYYSDSFSIDSEGHYEITALLPGTYELELQAFGHTTITRSIELDDKSVTVDFAPRKLRQ
jgi:hypothetical protein